MIGNAPYSGLISGANIVDESIGASALKDGLLSGVKNRIINGDMKIAQRGTSFANASAMYTLDRYSYYHVSTSAITISQSTDVPSGSGLSNSLRATVTTADTSIATGDYSTIIQNIEGYQVADLVGVPFTVSFWVRSSKTGVHCIRLRNSGVDRCYVAEYTINSSDTWEKKSVTISSGLPSDGTWNFNNGLGLLLSWTLASGSNSQTTSTDTWLSANVYQGTSNQVNCLDTVGNIFAITGVQLEKGSSSTDFEFRPYQFELDLCSRYYETTVVVFCFGGPAASTDVKLGGNYRVHKRATPTITTSSITGTVSATYTGIYTFQVNFSSGVNNNFGATVTAVAEL